MPLEDIPRFLAATDKVAAKAVLELENVNNTSDINKPVSTAQAAADAAVQAAAAADATAKDVVVASNAAAALAAHAASGGSSHPLATTSVAGFLSAADKTKLNNLAFETSGELVELAVPDRARVPYLLITYPLHVPVRNFLNSWGNFGGSQGPATLFSDGNHIFGSGTLGQPGTCPLGGQNVYTVPNGYEPPFTSRTQIPLTAEGSVAHVPALLESSPGTSAVTSVFLNTNTDVFFAEHALRNRCSDLFIGGLHNTISGDEIAVMISRNGFSIPTSKVCIYFHGAGDDYLSHITSAAGANNTQMRMATTINALLDDGWLILSFNGGTNPTHWGNPTSFTSVQNALTWLKSIFHVTTVVCLGQSMGGLTSLRAVCQLPGITRWYGIYPVCDLDAIYTAGLFTAGMRTAYGVSDDPGFAAASVGCDPMLFTLSQFNGKRFRMTASSGDTIVPKADHSDALAARITGNCDSVAVVSVSGDHGDASAFIPSDIIAFFNAA